MEKVKLGRTGLYVTRNSIGALPVQRLSMEDGAALMREAYDKGINFFDTARAYSDSEEKIALALGDVRDKVIIATKTGATTVEEFWADLSKSLTNLKTDYIDLYQFHVPEHVPLEDSGLYQAMLQAKQEGKIHHIGITCHKLSNARIALESGLYETIQYPLSALSTEEEMEFARECGKRDVGFIAMKALCGGLLTSASLSMAYLRPLAHVVPIWGIQKHSELQEILELEEAPPALDDAMMKRIEKERRELSGDFCRGCGYCMPCMVNIRINWCARMPQLLKRAVYQDFYTPAWKEEMYKINECTECGQCMAKCPYQLEIPKRLKASLECYLQFGKAMSL